MLLGRGFLGGLGRREGIGPLGRHQTIESITPSRPRRTRRDCVVARDTDCILEISLLLSASVLFPFMAGHKVGYIVLLTKARYQMTRLALELPVAVGVSRVPTW